MVLENTWLFYRCYWNIAYIQYTHPVKHHRFFDECIVSLLVASRHATRGLPFSMPSYNYFFKLNFYFR